MADPLQDLLNQLAGGGVAALTGGTTAGGVTKSGLYRYNAATGTFKRVSRRRHVITVSETGANFVLRALSAGARLAGGKKRSAGTFRFRSRRS